MNQVTVVYRGRRFRFSSFASAVDVIRFPVLRRRLLELTDEEVVAFLRDLFCLPVQQKRGR